MEIVKKSKQLVEGDERFERPYLIFLNQQLRHPHAVRLKRQQL